MSAIGRWSRQDIEHFVREITEDSDRPFVTAGDELVEAIMAYMDESGIPARLWKSGSISYITASDKAVKKMRETLMSRRTRSEEKIAYEKEKINRIDEQIAQIDAEFAERTSEK